MAISTGKICIPDTNQRQGRIHVQLNEASYSRNQMDIRTPGYAGYVSKPWGKPQGAGHFKI